MKSKQFWLREIDYGEVLQDIRRIIQEEKYTPPPESEIRLLTLVQTANLFHVSKKTIYNWSRNKILRRIEVDNKVFFEAREIEKLLEQNKI